MKLKISLVALALLVAFIILGIKLTDKISGGEKTFDEVAKALTTNSYAKETWGDSITVRHNGGPSEIEIGANNLRKGFSSLTVITAKNEVSLKVYWHEVSSSIAQIDGIYRSENFKSDMLLWESK